MLLYIYYIIYILYNIAIFHWVPSLWRMGRTSVRRCSGVRASLHGPRARGPDSQPKAHAQATSSVTAPLQTARQTASRVGVSTTAPPPRRRTPKPNSGGRRRHKTAATSLAPPVCAQKGKTAGASRTGLGPAKSLPAWP